LAKKPQTSLYSVHPSIAYTSAIIANFRKNTGKPIEDWVKLLKKEGIQGTKEQKDWLKTVHQLGNTQASMVVDHLAGKGADFTDAEAYLQIAPIHVETMYAGAKLALRPIHDRLVELARDLGSDVQICPCETIVPFYRQHVFGQIKPATKTRIDLGLALKNSKRKLSNRLIDTGGLAKKDRITHRFALANLEDIDEEVIDWLRHAYELDGTK